MAKTKKVIKRKKIVTNKPVDKKQNTKVIMAPKKAAPVKEKPVKIIKKKIVKKKPQTSQGPQIKSRIEKKKASVSFTRKASC